MTRAAMRSVIVTDFLTRLRSFLVLNQIIISFMVISTLMGCSTAGVIAGTAGGIVGATIVGARSPSSEIEQVYYLGVFDPQEQVPPTVYRLTVHGQSGFLSRMKFGSGWVPAEVIDSLNSSLSYNLKTPDGALTVSKGADSLSNIQTGRRLVLFGPEGFREAPRNHRLVIVMGSDPEKYFQAVDKVLGVVADARYKQVDSAFSKKILEALLQTKGNRDRLADLEADITIQLTDSEAR